MIRDQTNKYSIDNTIGFKRTHIDVKKLEYEKRKWNEINNFIGSKGEQQEQTLKKDQQAVNWKTIVENNNEDLNQNQSTNKVWSKTTPKTRNNVSKTNYNNLNNYVNHNNHLNKRTFEGMSTSSADRQHNSIMIQLNHLQKLLTKLLTRKSTKKLKSQKSLKFYNRTDEVLNRNEIDNQIETNEIEDNDEIEDNEDDERLANTIVDKLLLTDTGIKNLVFDWVISNWSVCSVDYGTGFQVSF